MKSRFIKLIVSITIVLGISASATLPTHAATSICDLPDSQVSAEVKKAAGCGGGSDQQLSNSIQAIINGIILVLGVVAVIVIVVGGVRYMTAAGDASKLQKAKSTILYAAIGLIICVLSFAITNFVINLVNNSSSESASPYSDVTDYNSDNYRQLLSKSIDFSEYLL